MNEQVIEILKETLLKLEQLENSQEQMVARMTVSSLLGCCYVPATMGIWVQQIGNATAEVMSASREIYRSQHDQPMQDSPLE